MAALLAGIGVDQLRGFGTWRARLLCVALLLMAVGEYTVGPSALWRDVLPTSAHRWVMAQPGQLRVLDCTPLSRIGIDLVAYRESHVPLAIDTGLFEFIWRKRWPRTATRISWFAWARRLTHCFRPARPQRLPASPVSPIVRCSM
jgi:hypothetical protein